MILEPPGDGTSIDMVEACRGFAERWPGCTFAFDEKAGGQQLLQRPEREFPECRHIPFPQDPRPLCDASMRFAELVAARKLRHPDHPQLTDHVLAASARFVGERWRFARPKGRHRWTDGLTAASIAVSLVGRVEEVTPFVWTIVPEDEDDWPGAGVGVICVPTSRDSTVTTRATAVAGRSSSAATALIGKLPSLRRRPTAHALTARPRWPGHERWCAATEARRRFGRSSSSPRTDRVGCSTWAGG